MPPNARDPRRAEMTQLPLRVDVSTGLPLTGFEQVPGAAGAGRYMTARTRSAMISMSTTHCPKASRLDYCTARDRAEMVVDRRKCDNLASS